VIRIYKKIAGKHSSCESLGHHQFLKIYLKRAFLTFNWLVPWWQRVQHVLNACICKVFYCQDRKTASQHICWRAATAT